MVRGGASFRVQLQSTENIQNERNVCNMVCVCVICECLCMHMYTFCVCVHVCACLCVCVCVRACVCNLCASETAVVLSRSQINRFPPWSTQANRFDEL